MTYALFVEDALAAYPLLKLAPQCRLAKRPPSGSRLCVIAELPNDYLLIEFPMVERERPVLGL